jgi:hypothetical protein
MKKFLNRITFFGGGLLAAYVGLVRPWISRWNATDDELLKVQPGDELIPHPLLHTTRSVLIQAPAEKVWPWIVQIGYGRGGFYSFDQLERAAGLEGLHSATGIDPALQKLKQGDTVHISPVTPMTVETLLPNRAMVLHTVMSPFTAQALDPQNPPQPCIDWTWSFLVTPLNDYACRLASRVRAVYAPYFMLWSLVALGIEPAAFVMDRKMLLTIKERAEA